jgi:hypothetical protein
VIVDALIATSEDLDAIGKEMKRGRTLPSPGASFPTVVQKLRLF